MAAQALHGFSVLPGELRNIIWELSLPGPRRIKPILLLKGTANPRREPLPCSQVCDPAMLQINRESRAIALQFYERREHYKHRFGQYVNFELDNFYFAGEDLRYEPPARRILAQREEDFNISREDRSRIKNLILGFSWTSYADSIRFRSSHTIEDTFRGFHFSHMIEDAFRGCLLTFECLKVIKIEIWRGDDAHCHPAWNPLTNPKPDLAENQIMMLRQRLKQVLGLISLVKASKQEAWEAPTLRIQVERADRQLYAG